MCLPPSFTVGHEAQRRQLAFPRAHSKGEVWQGFKPRMVPLSREKLKNQILKTRPPSEHLGLASLSFKDGLLEFQCSADQSLSGA